MIALIFLRKHWGKLLVALFALCFFGYIDEMVEGLGFNSERMVEVQKVERLAPFPLERSRLEVRHSSGMFHDNTTIYFKSKPEVVAQWLRNSPGVQNAKSVLKEEGTTCYSLHPGFLYVSADQTEVGINLGQAIDGPTTWSPIPPRQR